MGLVFFGALLGGLFFIGRNVALTFMNWRNATRGMASRHVLEPLTGPIIVTLAFCVVDIAPRTLMWPLALPWVLDLGTWSAASALLRRFRRSDT
jgi:hypothetical protein